MTQMSNGLQLGMFQSSSNTEIAWILISIIDTTAENKVLMNTLLFKYIYIGFNNYFVTTSFFICSSKQWFIYKTRTFRVIGQLKTVQQMCLTSVSNLQ